MSESSGENKGDKKVSPEGGQAESVDSQVPVGDKDVNTSIDGNDSATLHQLQTPIAFNVITAPKVCPPGYRMDATGKCRKIM